MPMHQSFTIHDERHYPELWKIEQTAYEQYENNVKKINEEILKYKKNNTKTYIIKNNELLSLIYKNNELIIKIMNKYYNDKKLSFEFINDIVLTKIDVIFYIACSIGYICVIILSLSYCYFLWHERKKI